MAEDAFNKIKKSITKSVVAVNVKTSVYLDTSKLKIQISNVEKEIQDLYNTLGKSVYTLWKQDDLVFNSLTGTLQSIQDKYLKIDTLLKSIEELEKHESDIFGSKDHNFKEVQVVANNRDVITCSECNTQYATQVKFCKKCGNKMT